MTIVVECVAAVDGVPVEPCGSLGGVALAPTLRELDPSTTIDPGQLANVFSYGLSLVGIVFVVGLTVGSIMRVIRSA